MERKRPIAMVAVFIAATLFGFIGLCSRYFYNDCNLGPMEVTMIRVLVSSVAMLVVIGIFARNQLQIGLKNIPLMIAFGAFKMASDVTFFFSQNTITLCLSTLLQMTAPYYVMLLSLMLFKERLTFKKMMCMGIGTIGCILVTGILFGELDIQVEGILSALLSGLFLGLFMICSKFSNDRGIKPSASLFYAMLVADILTIPFCNVGDIVTAVSDPVGIGNALALGILMTLIPYYLFVWSTQHIEPTLAIIISVSEVVTAAIVGFIFFDEKLTVFGMIGMILIMMSVILMSVKFRRVFKKRFAKYIHSESNHS